MKTEELELDITEDGIEEIATLSAEINSTVENIGARRLHTVLEKILEDVSFDASERGGDTVTVDATYVRDQIGELAKDTDLSKFIL